MTYDGTEHTATGTATGVGGVSLSAGLALTSTSHTAAGTYTTDAWSFHDATGNYADASGTVSDTINLATLTVVANSATRVYGTVNPTFTGSVAGQQGSDTFSESFLTAASITSPVNTYTITPSVTGTNLADYTQSIVAGTLAVTKAGTLTSLAVSSASITPGQNETLTAQVLSSTTGTPTGSVSFYDGTALLGAATLNAGTASYSTAALVPGLTHTLTAVYNGDTNFTGSSTASSTAVTVAPLNFTITLTGPSNLTIQPGSSVSFQFKVSPDFGSYAGTVNFALSGVQSGYTVTFSPANIAPNGGPQTVTVTIQAPRQPLNCGRISLRLRAGARHRLPWPFCCSSESAGCTNTGARCGEFCACWRCWAQARRLRCSVDAEARMASLPRRSRKLYAHPDGHIR